MDMLNPALQAFFLYQQAKYLPQKAKSFKTRYKYEIENAEKMRQKNEQEVEEIARLHSLYRTGDIKEGRIQQLRSAAGIGLQGAVNFQRSMANNMLAISIPYALGTLASGGARLANQFGIHNTILDNIGIKGAAISNALVTPMKILDYAQYINPSYAVARSITKAIYGTLGGSIGTLGSTFLGPMATAMIMPYVNKFMGKIIKAITGGNISSNKIGKLKPLATDIRLLKASEFVDEEPLNYTNNLINQIQSIDPDGQKFNIVELAQLNMLATIASNTSSIPILTSEIINNFIRKNVVSTNRYNANIDKLKQYYIAQAYKDVIDKHATRMEHGKFAHTFTENIGLAATEFSAFLNQMGILFDPLKQLQIVLSGGNIREELNRFKKGFQDIEQRKSTLFAKRLGIGGEESFATAYYSLTEDSQKILSRAKTFEDAQIGLLSGIYEFSRLTALEIATIRTRGFGIKEPIKYNIIGKSYEEEGGLINWLSNKVPLFETVRTLMGGIRQIAALTAERFLDEKNILRQIIGAPRVYAYHNDIYNLLAEGFNETRDVSFIKRKLEPFIEQLNKRLLEIPILRLFANENRLSFVQRAKLERQEKAKSEIEAIKKELGLEKLEDQQLFYKYATTSMPEQFDLAIYHLSNIALFSQAIMFNTAAVARAIAGQGEISKPYDRVIREINPYTGRLETEQEHEQFMGAAMKTIFEKVNENAFESKTTIRRLLDTMKYAFKKGDRKGTDERLIRGLIEGLAYTFEEERNTAASSWRFTTSMMKKPLFTKDFLEKLRQSKNPSEIVKQSSDIEEIIKNKHNYGNIKFKDYSELETPIQFMKVDVAKITAPEFEKFEQKLLTYIPSSELPFAVDLLKLQTKIELNIDQIKTAAKIFATELFKLFKNQTYEYKNYENIKVKYDYLLPSKTTSGTINISKDNTLEGVQDVIDAEIVENESKQTKYLNEIVKNTRELKKQLKLPLLANSLPDTTKAKNEKTDENEFSLLDLIFDKKNKKPSGKLSSIKKIGSKLLAGGRALLTNPLAIGTATFLAGVKGIYDLNYGREKELIDMLEEKGIIHHNYLGTSEILDYKALQSLPLEMLTQLLSFDDWSEKDKQYIQKIIDKKTVAKSLATKSLKGFELNEYLNKRKATSKQGLLAKSVSFVTHTVDNMLGSLIPTNINSKDKEIYSDLEASEIIRYSTLPFVKSEIRDWDAITKLPTNMLESLLKLNLSEHDRSQLQEIIKLRNKNKVVSSEAKKPENTKNVSIKDKIKHVVNRSPVASVVKIFTSSDLISALEEKGILEHNVFGNSVIKDWDAVAKLSKRDIRKLIEFDDWDEKTKERLEKLYYKQVGEKVVQERNIKSTPKPLKSKNSIEDVVTKTESEELTIGDLFTMLASKFDQLINITAAGHAGQIDATVKGFSKFIETKKQPKHPISE